MNTKLLRKTNLSLDREELMVNETLFHNANGYLGVRSNFEEGVPEGVGSIRGEYLNGFYDFADMPQAEKLCGLCEEKQTMLNRPDLFLPIYIISNIWQNVGWGSIIFLSALTGIDPGLYEAAKIDGAGRFRQLISVTLPGILPTIIIMFILEVGKMFNVGHEKILLLYNPITYETADVISTYVYRKGLLEANWSFSTAVGMFNSVVSFCLVYFTNRFSRRSGTSLW